MLENDSFWWRFSDPRRIIGPVILFGTVEEAVWYSIHAGRGLTPWKGEVIPSDSVLGHVKNNINGHKIDKLRKLVSPFIRTVRQL